MLNERRTGLVVNNNNQRKLTKDFDQMYFTYVNFQKQTRVRQRDGDRGNIQNIKGQELFFYCLLCLGEI